VRYTTRNVKALTLLATCCGLLLAGCGGGSSTPPPAADTSRDGSGKGGAQTTQSNAKITVEEALNLGLVGELFVEGYVVEKDGVPHLCESVAESSPPQCGEPSIELVGWRSGEIADKPVTIEGETDGETLIVIDQ
jgi:hypothetical protein